MSIWYRYALFLFLTLTLLWGMGEVLEWAILRFDPSEPKVLDMLALEEETYDILFLGNSTAMQGFVPAVVDSLLGTQSYNLALGGATILQNELSLRQYLRHNEAPKLLVYGLFVNEKRWEFEPRASVYQGLDRNIKQYYLDWKQQHQREHNAQRTFFNQFPFFRNRLGLEHGLKYLVDGENREYVYEQGFLNSSVSNEIPSELPIHDSGLDREALKSLDQLCKEIELPILYIELPDSPIFSRTTQYRDTTLNAIRSVVGDRFISLNQSPYIEQLPRSDWTGINHLKKSGATKVTKWVVEQLKEDLLENE